MDKYKYNKYKNKYMNYKNQSGGVRRSDLVYAQNQDTNHNGTLEEKKTLYSTQLQTLNASVRQRRGTFEETQVDIKIERLELIIKCIDEQLLLQSKLSRIIKSDDNAKQIETIESLIEYNTLVINNFEYNVKLIEYEEKARPFIRTIEFQEQMIADHPRDTQRISTSKELILNAHNNLERIKLDIDKYKEWIEDVLNEFKTYNTSHIEKLDILKLYKSKIEEERILNEETEEIKDILAKNIKELTELKSQSGMSIERILKENERILKEKIEMSKKENERILNEKIEMSKKKEDELDKINKEIQEILDSNIAKLTNLKQIKSIGDDIVLLN